MEQAVLAAECGCKYISPFVHELKAFFDESYDDGGANLALCVEVQQYYKRFCYPTKVKAAGLLSVGEAKQLAGVDAITIAPDLLRTLASEAVEEDVSLLTKDKTLKCELDRLTYVDDEAAWKEAFAKANNGRGLRNTTQVDSRDLMVDQNTDYTKAIDIFREYQNKAEQLMLAKSAVEV